MMRLDGPQRAQIHEAILAGFSPTDLARLTRFEMDVDLESIVSNGPMNQVAFDLVLWAERTGRIEKLLSALQRYNPHNIELRAITAPLLAEFEAAAPRPAGAAVLDGPRRKRLRAALMDQFPTRKSLAMLCDDSLSLNLNEIASGSSDLTETVFDLIQWTSIDPHTHLRPLLAEAVRQRPNSAELRELDREIFGDGETVSGTPAR